ncbi:ribulose-phosphate 3-epimerase [Ohessyouella blattaphilus]|uniref:Ribulose-phosphate 3-epimerase n=1 Tax=Ohessyouella blattaphilus TaxID=2949333 RepID=A0ABT1EGH2_9FIRM|nr:ribulose-phosphate 3-epimerase [Ohessyouella blattaphilus]MCP1109611.1 ribulose-phosphate 3-epimerase [Ohessyouella blattaphilus]MCR8563005.1 ribulose-phosphate 3-epimerase [Ohessyouella blattaphilus]
MKKILSPSILAADFGYLKEEIEKTSAAGAAYLHFDVMDGLFVPSISFGMPVLQSIKKYTDQVMDVHLMIQEPIRYVEDFASAGADIITVHYEACENLKETIAKIRAVGKKVGVSIKPGTPVTVIEEFLTDIDMLLIMTVEPGFGGQSFIPESLERIKEAREIMEKNARQIDIEVDGGIYLHNIEEVLAAGANVIVAGSAVFKGDAMKNVKDFMEIFGE